MRADFSLGRGGDVLLTNLNQVRSGTRVGAAVMNPKAPDVTLLKPGAELTPDIIARLRRRSVTQVWVEHELTRDLDAAVAPELSRVKLQIYHHLKSDFEQLEQRTVTKSQVQSYRRAVVDLIREIVNHRAFANLTDQLFDADNELISHSSNVAYLATMVGLELESYLVRERPKIPAARARELINLGLGAMLHDIGKTTLGPEASRRHEALESDKPRDSAPYYRHPAVGQQMLGGAEVSATVRHVVLAHHRRYDGTGWPDIVKLSAGGVRSQPAGRRLHIFTRIVSAANVLDNLLQAADGTRRPPVAALHDFAGPRFDGWFDPVVRLAVLRRIPPFAVGSRVVLNDGRSAVVIAPNLSQPCRPSIRLLDGKDKRSGREPETVNLAEHPPLSVVSCAGADVQKWVFQLAEPKKRKTPPAADRPQAA
ncbi:MAG: HD-GYP domain-containing protein [Planctomycetota bacterium]|jgi:HD-GYP domain-containing protein (c-di-GMP phosphodiesterase class II)